MPLRPEEISTARLPRNLLGGFKARPTDELLKRVAWDYRQLLEDSRRLGETGDQLERRVHELEARVHELESELEHRRDAHEVGGTLIAAAQRTARELRESARNDGDATLKKARDRARVLEAEAERRLHAATEAQRVAADLRVRIRAALDSVLAENGASHSSPAA